MQSALVVQPAARPVLLRDVASLMFRHQRRLTVSFFTVVCLALVAALMLPRKYESSVKLLVERERADVVISPARNDAYQGVSAEISEAELNSELELLRTDDILRGVVMRTGLAGKNPSPEAIDQAVLRLNAALHLEPVNKSNIIGVTYSSTSPQLSANVLNTLTALFLEKNLRVRRPTGQYQFFDQQAERYKEQMAQIEKQLVASPIISPQLLRDRTLEKMVELKAAAAGTVAAIAEVQRRIASLKDLQTGMPERLVTERRTQDNPQLLQTMKGTLLTLELERDQLLAKYQPTYRPVQDLDRRIADTRAAIQLEESKPVREETTNQNTAYEWIRTEKAKAEAELQGLLGRQSADSHILSGYNEALSNLNTHGMQEQDLQREARSAEANYLLYSQKREEARISEELDQKKILNVVVVQSAFVPAVHVHRRRKLAMLGGIVAILISVAIVLISDFFDPRFRSPHELATFLDMPVLAAIPSSYELMKLNPTRRQERGVPKNGSLT
jgi:uncharacterized protein involved in exopolysaccharide biosynthesis